MSKGEVTKERIIEQTAPVFNQMGFAGCSLSDIMAATGLKKGGIYNHFESKEDLALQAFDHAAELSAARFSNRIAAQDHAVDKLIAFAEVFRENHQNPLVKGGCFVMNTAVESDDTHPALRERAQQAMQRWRKRIIDIIEAGVPQGELKPQSDPDVVATRIISTLEGGTMMSRLYGDPIHLHRAIEYVTEYIRRDLAA